MNRPWWIATLVVALLAVAAPSVAAPRNARGFAFATNAHVPLAPEGYRRDQPAASDVTPCPVVAGVIAPHGEADPAAPGGEPGTLRHGRAVPDCQGEVAPPPL